METPLLLQPEQQPSYDPQPTGVSTVQQVYWTLAVIITAQNDKGFTSSSQTMQAYTDSYTTIGYS